MNHRLQQFLGAENITQSQFADSIGVARASVSHILAGRNKPGFDFIENMARRYPTLNLEWLITGKGKMYKGDSTSKKEADSDVLFAYEEEIDNFPATSKEASTPQGIPASMLQDVPASLVNKAPELQLQTAPENRPYATPEKKDIQVGTKSQEQLQQASVTHSGSHGISKIIMFFEDGTYKELV